MANTPLEVKKPAPVPAPARDAWQSLRSEMDDLFDRFAGTFGMPSLRRMFDAFPAPSVTSTFSMPAPAIDIIEDAGGYRLTAELPGMTEADIHVELTGDTLTLKGEKKQESEHADKNYTLSERSYGSFQRSFYLPEGVDRDKLDASFAKGVLTISMPKLPAAVATAKKIEVKGG
jgi:HSP20 family protein